MLASSTTAAAATIVRHQLSSSLRWAAGGWIFFIAENVILSENRTFLIDTLGDDGYHGLYGTLSTAACASIAYAYLYRLPTVVVLVKKPTSSYLTVATSWVLLSTGMVMFSQTIPTLRTPIALPMTTTTSPPVIESGKIGGGDGGVVIGPGDGSSSSSWNLRVQCPFDFADSWSRISKSSSEPRGLDRITRHPGLWSFGLVGLGHALLLSPTAAPAHFVWWCGPAAVALVGGYHTDSRYRRNLGGTLSPEQDAVTSNVPFWAMISGQQGPYAFNSLLQEIKPLNALLATGFATWWVLATLRRQNAAMQILRRAL